MAAAIDQLGGGQWIYTFFTVRNFTLSQTPIGMLFCKENMK